MYERGRDMLLWLLRAMPSVYAEAAFAKLRGAAAPAPMPEEAPPPAPAPEPAPESAPVSASERPPLASHDPEAYRRAHPLSGTYYGDPAGLEQLLRMHGLRIGLRGDDIVLEGTRRLRGEQMVELFGFVWRHRASLDALADIKHGRAGQR